MERRAPPQGTDLKVLTPPFITSCFNAFSRVDVRVEVRIPGSVDAFVVDARGERHETSPEIWQEVYLSALLRAILYADDANYRLAGYRKLDPINSPDAEHRFLQAAENLFFKGERFEMRTWYCSCFPHILSPESQGGSLAQTQKYKWPLSSRII